MKAKTIMISYCSVDERYARKIYRFISRTEYNVWMAPDDIDQSSNYEEQIIKAIEESSIFIVIVSKNTYRSDHVLSEVRTAFNKKKRLIVLKIDSSKYSKNFDYFLGDKQWIDFRDTKENYTELNDAIMYKKRKKFNDKKYYLVLISIACICVVIGGASFYYFSSKSGEENQLEYVGAKKPDYEKCLTTDDYSIVYNDKGNYSFAYPKDFFQTEEHTADDYSFEAADGFTSLKIERKKHEENPLKYIKKIYKQEKSKVNIDTDNAGVAVVSDEIDERGWTHCVVGGNWKNDFSKGSYSVIASDGDYVYSMRFQYYVSEKNKDGYYNEQTYMIDCLYRFCSFSSSSYDPRSFSDFLNDKKQVE